MKRFEEIFSVGFVAAFICLTMCRGQLKAEGWVPYFTNYHSMLRWEERCAFTNGMERSYEISQTQYLEGNFFICISNEIVCPSFNALIFDEGIPTNQYSIALFQGDEIGFTIRANLPMASANVPRWAARLKFYLSSRFDGHSPKFTSEAIAEDKMEKEKMLLPLGFPSTLKDEYWLPSKRIEEDTIGLDRVLAGMPNETGLYPLNRIWLVRDEPFCWIYWVNHGLPFSQRRDPLEYDPKFRPQIDAASKEAIEAISKNGNFFDNLNVIQQQVHQILKRKYGISWNMPDSLN